MQMNYARTDITSSRIIPLIWMYGNECGKKRFLSILLLLSTISTFFLLSPATYFFELTQIDV